MFQWKNLQFGDSEIRKQGGKSVNADSALWYLSLEVLFERIVSKLRGSLGKKQKFGCALVECKMPWQGVHVEVYSLRWKCRWGWAGGGWYGWRRGNQGGECKQKLRGLRREPCPITPSPLQYSTDDKREGGNSEGKEVPFPGSLETQNLKPDIITLPVREAVGVYGGWVPPDASAVKGGAGA